MPISLPGLIFQLTINNGMHLKYSHKDLVHQLVNHRSHIQFLQTIEYDRAIEYLNNIYIYYFRQLKGSMSV